MDPVEVELRLHLARQMACKGLAGKHAFWHWSIGSVESFHQKFFSPNGHLLDTSLCSAHRYPPTSVEGRKAGTQLAQGWYGCLLQLAGDLDYYAKYLSTPRWSSHSKCCSQCRATFEGHLSWLDNRHPTQGGRMHCSHLPHGEAILILPALCFSFQACQLCPSQWTGCIVFSLDGFICHCTAGS